MGLCRQDKRARCSLFNILVVKQQHQLQETPVQWDGFIFPKVPHTDTCGAVSRPNMSSSSWEWQVKHGVSNGVWRDCVCLQGHTRCVTVPLCLSLHVQRLPLMHHSLSSYLQKMELFTQSERFLFFFLMGLFIFSACLWIRADRRLCQGGNSRDCCWEMIALHCYSY